MMFKHTILLACLVSSALLGAHADVEPDNGIPDEAWPRPIVVYSNGKEFKIEQFEPDVPNFKGLSKARYEFDLKIIKEMTDALNRLTDTVFRGAYSWTISTEIVKLTSAAGMIAWRNKKLKSMDKHSPRLNSGLGATNGALLEKLIAEPVNGGAEEVIDIKEAKHRVDTLMKALREIVPKSKTGLVLNWSLMTVDGQKLEDYFRPAIQKLTRGKRGSSQVRGLISFVAGKLEATKYDFVKDDKSTLQAGEGEEEFDFGEDFGEDILGEDSVERV